MSESNLSTNPSLFYEAPASELIVIDCKGSMMQAAISDWQHGGEFSAPYDVYWDDSEFSSSDIFLIANSEFN